MINFVLCNNLCSITNVFLNLFKCCKKRSSSSNSIYNTNSDNKNYLIVDKDLNYSYELDLDNMRFYIINIDLIFITSNIYDLSGKHIKTYFPKDLYNFYNTIFKSAFIPENDDISLHIILNDIHILLKCYKLKDNINNVIGIVLEEIPFKFIQKYNYQNSV